MLQQAESRKPAPSKEVRHQRDARQAKRSSREEKFKEPDTSEEEPDRLVDLSVKLAMLLVKNHRDGLNAYKATKSSGIDKIIDIVETGCREAEQMDIEFLRR